MKKMIMLFGVFVCLFLGLNLVSAESEGPVNAVADFIGEVGNAVEPVLRVTLGDIDGGSGDMFLVKLLVFFLMISLFYVASKRVPGIQDKPIVVLLVSVILGILATRFLSSKELVELVWLPTGVVGVALTALLPFILFFFFIESFDNSIIRKVGWILFTVLFFALAVVRWDYFENTVEGPLQGFNLAWIYIIVGVLSLASFLWDKYIHSRFVSAEMEAKRAELNTLGISKIQEQINDWKGVISNEGSTDKMVKNAQRQIKKLEKRMEALSRS